MRVFAMIGADVPGRFHLGDIGHIEFIRVKAADGVACFHGCIQMVLDA